MVGFLENVGPGAYDIPDLTGIRQVRGSYNNAPSYTIPHGNICKKLFISKSHSRVLILTYLIEIVK